LRHSSSILRREWSLTEQFKYPAYEKAGGWLIDVVAGMLDEGETPEQGVRREILEESGFEAVAIEPIATFFVSPGGSSERIFLFCATVRGGAPPSGGGVASEHEDIKIIAWSIDEFMTRFRAGALQDAKALIAACWLKDNLERILPAVRGNSAVV
jgi:nudix-type nucleoside diphosphatase (YffH/AdpP family)